MYIHIHIYINTYTYKHTHLYLHTQTYTYTHLNTYIHVYINIHIVGGGFLIRYFMKTNYIAYPHLSNFVPPPWLPPPILKTHCSFCCLVSLPEWAMVSHLICYFNNIMDLNMLSLDTSVLEEIAICLCNRVLSLLRSDT